jgi:adrenodoxin-NADP+ reductase
MAQCAHRVARRLGGTRRFASATGAPWHVAIVGSGPAGFYHADFLLKADPNVRVDIFERLPVPFGLVRYGVAPDHQSVKEVTKRFDQIASEPRCSLLANVHIGPGAPPTAASVPLAELREQYHAVVLAYGADTDRTLGLPGEDLDGVYSARQFVEWYNGHPKAVDRSFNLQSCETAVIVGHGNVALDCARMLCSTPDQLRGETDVAAHAVAELSESSVRQVRSCSARLPSHRTRHSAARGLSRAH